MKKKLDITINFIKHLEKLGEGKIHWEKWDELVEQTKRDIEEYLKNNKYKIKIRNCNTCYAYNKEGELVHVFESFKDCANNLNANATTIKRYIDKQWVYNELLLSKEELKPDVAFAIYRMATEHGNIYTKTSNPVYCYNQDGKLVSIYESLRDWAFHENNDNVNSRLYKEDRRINNKLVSLNYYATDVARELYKTTTVLTHRKAREKKRFNIYNSNGELYKKGCDSGLSARILKISRSNFSVKSSKNDVFYSNGYLVSKTDLSTLEAQEMVKKLK
jgi:hypothetical protein